METEGKKDVLFYPTLDKRESERKKEGETKTIKNCLIDHPDPMQPPATYLQSDEGCRPKKMAMGDLLPILRKEWTSGYEVDFIDLTMKKGNWTAEETKQLFDHQVNEGNILIDPDRLWRWKP